MDEEGADERDDNRGGRHQGIVVEIPCKGQIGCSEVQTTEGNSFRQLANVRACDLGEWHGTQSRR